MGPFVNDAHVNVGVKSRLLKGVICDEGGVNEWLEEEEEGKIVRE